MPKDRISALRIERDLLLTLCRSLTREQWRTPSRASGWTVHDVVAHIGSGCHSMFSPAATKMLFSKDIERANDGFVEERRNWSPSRVLDEYTKWSARVVSLAAAVSRTPAARIPLPLAELGTFPAALLLGGALVFDHHAHLRHDVLPALGLPDPGTDANRTSVVTEWMIAVLGNQLKQDPPTWLDRPVTFSLQGEGGGTWTFLPGGRLMPGSDSGETRIDGDVNEFPEWGTTRCDWRDRTVSIVGDVEYAARLLDHINVV